MKFHHFGDKGGVFTMKKVKWWSSYIVIARRERSEGRGNPSCLGERGRVVCSLTKGQWIATGLRPRDDKGGVGA